MYKTFTLTFLFTCIFSTEESNDNSFARVVLQKGFVDRTSLIERFLGEYSWKKLWLINAPSGFGKTTNIDMIKKFAEISVTPNGEPLPAYRTDNFKLFSKSYNSEVLEIAKDQNFFLKHIARYPVLYFNFKNVTVENVEFMKSFWEHVVNPACKEHEYLLRSEKVKNKLTKICQGTYSNSELSKFGADFIDALHDHFGKKVIVLGDELDAPLKRFIFCPKVDKTTVNTTFDFFKTLFLAIKDSPNVERILLTSALRVDWAYVPDGFEQISYYSYFTLYGHLTRYYIMTEGDVRKLGAQFGATQHDYDEIRKLYKGYRLANTNTTVYSLHVRNHFLQLNSVPNPAGKVQQNYDKALRPFLGAFLLPYAGGQLIRNFESGVLHQAVCVDFQYDAINLHCLNFMMKINVNAKPQIVSSDFDFGRPNILFIQFLFEEGYLSFNSSYASLQSFTEFRFPNEIIKSTFRVLITDALEAHYQIPKSVRDRFVRTLADIDGTKKSCEENMNALISLVEHSRFKLDDEAALCELVYSALFCSKDVDKLKSECRFYYEHCSIIAMLKIGGQTEKVELQKDLKGVSFSLSNRRDLYDETDDSGKFILQNRDYMLDWEIDHAAGEKKARLMEAELCVGFGVGEKSYLGAYVYNSSDASYLKGVITLRKPKQK